jgi:hypothetical protein
MMDFVILFQVNAKGAVALCHATSWFDKSAGLMGEIVEWPVSGSTFVGAKS